MNFDYSKICPGARDLVKRLHELGLETTDSGDGSNHAEGMEGALPFVHAAGPVPDWKWGLVEFADWLQERLKGYVVDVSYHPSSGHKIYTVILPTDEWLDEPLTDEEKQAAEKASEATKEF